MGKGWQWPGDHAESFSCSSRASWSPEPGHEVAGADGHPSGMQFKKTNREQLLSAERYFNIKKSPNVSKVLEGDIRVEKQDIRYAKKENKGMNIQSHSR